MLHNLYLPGAGVHGRMHAGVHADPNGQHGREGYDRRKGIDVSAL
jgi:hypothetical protein